MFTLIIIGIILFVFCLIGWKFLWQASVLSETDCVIITVDLGCDLKPQNVAIMGLWRDFAAKKAHPKAQQGYSKMFQTEH